MQDDPIAILSQSFADIAVESAKLAKDSTTVARIVKKLARADGYEALKPLEKDLAQLATLEASVGVVSAAAAAAAVGAKVWLDGEWQRRAGNFAVELHEFLIIRGLTPAWAGNALTVGRFAIAMDARNDRAALLYTGEVVVERLPLNSQRIADALVELGRRLEKQQTAPETFRDQLLKAYQDAVRERGVASGARVPLPAVHFAAFLRRQSDRAKQDPRNGRLKEYPRYQFAWDLALLRGESAWLDRQGVRIELHLANSVAARSRSNSLTVLDVDGAPAVLGEMTVTSG